MSELCAKCADRTGDCMYCNCGVFAKLPDSIFHVGKDTPQPNKMVADHSEQVLDMVKPETKLTADQQIRARALELAIMSFGATIKQIGHDELTTWTYKFEDYIREGRKG